MKRTLMALVVSAAVIAPAQAEVGPTVTVPANAFLRDPDFWVATTTNLIGTGYFFTRVHAPAAAPYFGAGTELTGIPTLALSIADVARKKTDFGTWAGIGYATWALGAATVDHILKLEYRNPVKPAVLVPYVVGYYLAVGSLSAAQYRNGYLPWAIAGGSCLLDIAASFHARAKGAEQTRK